MATTIFSCQTTGIQGELVEVEVDILQGISIFSIVGLGDTAVIEAKERVRSAMKNSGVVYPQQKKIINLAPAHLRKRGPHFDLPIALGLLIASGQLQFSQWKKTMVAGELALDGSIRPINGVLTMARFAKQNDYPNLLIPASNRAEAQLIKGLNIVGVSHLKELIAYVNEGVVPEQQKAKPAAVAPPEQLTFDDIHGNATAKRALEIAAAGGHHILLIGPPGIGKTVLAKAFASILPPLTHEEQLEVLQIHSSRAPLENLFVRRPFRQVHPSCTLTALIGGGSNLKPGEASLAHRGVLFIDELPEFPRAHVESLRQPLEEKVIHLARSTGTISYPAQFIMVASMNPCPCGHFNDVRKACTCRPYQIMQYQKKLSGPLLDRLDLMVEVQRTSTEAFHKATTSTQKTIKKRVATARALQASRFKSMTIQTNSEMNAKQVHELCPLTKTCENLVIKAGEQFALSGRQYYQTIKTARTIADLAQSPQIELRHLAEALHYRQSIAPVQ